MVSMFWFQRRNIQTNLLLDLISWEIFPSLCFITPSYIFVTCDISLLFIYCYLPLRQTGAHYIYNLLLSA
jgi:hypothetical protein